MHRKYVRVLLILFLLTLNACIIPARLNYDPLPLETISAIVDMTLTPALADEPAFSDVNTPEPGFDETGNPIAKVFLHDGLPISVINAFNIQGLEVSSVPEETSLKVLIGPGHPDPDPSKYVDWVYVLAAPFYTLTDEISFEAFSSLWQGTHPPNSQFEQILISPQTLSAMTTLLGKPDENTVMLLQDGQSALVPLTSRNTLYILPFEELQPHYKILRVDGQSPIDQAFTPDTYPLTLQIWSEGDFGGSNLVLPDTNYDPGKRTILLMTGVTALVRATAHRMEMKGYEYPAQDIIHWLVDADLTHISNEVAFAENCPTPNPVQKDLIFCSNPAYIQLLEHIDADIIELTGNHLQDYETSALELTLNLYESGGFSTYAGGQTLAEASEPLQIYHNGNAFAFLGCNPVGPPNVWAGDSKPGAAPCGDYIWLLEKIHTLRSQGYIPIVTLQYYEDYSAYPSSQMTSDFQRLADAGAVVVNGSQAHTPKVMEFYNGSFIHYGLGNLFFDQMEVYSNDQLLPYTREEFLDRLVFYDGELISVELLTAMLEDYARPRPMTESERNAFLDRIFSIATNP